MGPAAPAAGAPQRRARPRRRQHARRGHRRGLRAVAAAPPSDGAPRRFKDQLAADEVARLAAALQAADPTLDVEVFRRAALDGLEELELKARVAHLARALDAALPVGFVAGAGVVCRAAEAGRLTGWEAWPLPAWVALAGLDEPEAALDALAVLTRHASAEFAVRPFIERHPSLTLGRLERWSCSDDLHLRRLASEGSRPRLPWGSRLVALQRDPTPTLGLLDRLRTDEEEYVRRSVANHLGDIAKDHPALACAIAARWQAEGGPHVERVVRHGLRALVKRGDPAALALLGADPTAPLEVLDLRVEPAVAELGGHVMIACVVASGAEEPVRAVVDYVVGFPRADGGVGPRVFKLATIDLEPGERRALRRRHGLREVTTRVSRAGTHTVGIQVNGRVRAETSFELARP